MQSIRSPTGGVNGEDSLGYSESEQLQFSYPPKDRRNRHGGGRGSGENQTFGMSGGMAGIVERDESGQEIK